MNRHPLFWEVLESRCSIRKFMPAPVPSEMVQRILAAGIKAPNARNRQSWRFVVIAKPELIARLADTLNENYRRDMLSRGKSVDEVDQLVKNRKERICAAPLIIIMFVDLADLERCSPGDLASPEYLMAVQSSALAGGQMLLAAQALGLGGLWMGGVLYAQEKLCSTFDLPETWLAQGMLLIGYAAEHPAKKARKPIQEVLKVLE